MPLSQRCQKSFDRMSVNLGFVYYRQQGVRLTRTTDTSVLVRIGKTRSQQTEVEVDWGDAILGEVNAYCDCEQYNSGKLCPHVWTALLAIDRHGIDTGSGRGALRVLHEFEELDDPDFDEEDEDEFGDEDEYVAPIRLIERKRKFTSGVEEPDWRTLLQGIGAEPAPAGLIARRPATPAGDSEPWYVLDVSSSTKTGQLVIDLYQRQRNQDGGLGPGRKLVVHRGPSLNFADREDENIVHLLLGCAATEQTSYPGLPFYPSFLQPNISQFQLNRAIAESVVPRLCATGRFVWVLDASLPADEWRHMTWDDGPGWKFRAAFKSDSKGKTWHLTGELYRDGQTAPLQSAVLLLQAGYVLFENCLARLDARPTDFSWIQVLRRQPAIEVPCSARTELLDSLCQRSELPEIEFPAGAAGGTAGGHSAGAIADPFAAVPNLLRPEFLLCGRRVSLWRAGDRFSGPAACLVRCHERGGRAARSSS